jgi:hypothetical protein
MGLGQALVSNFERYFDLNGTDETPWLLAIKKLVKKFRGAVQTRGVLIFLSNTTLNDRSWATRKLSPAPGWIVADPRGDRPGPKSWRLNRGKTSSLGPSTR